MWCGSRLCLDITNDWTSADHTTQYRVHWAEEFVSWHGCTGSFFRQVMMTSSNGNIFRVTGPLCGEFTGPGEFPTQRPVTRSFDVFCDLRPNTRLSKQPWGWWFETPSWSLWRHCNVHSNPFDTLIVLATPKRTSNGNWRKPQFKWKMS